MRFGSRNTTGSGSRIAASNRPYARDGDDGITLDPVDQKTAELVRVQFVAVQGEVVFPFAAEFGRRQVERNGRLQAGFQARLLDRPDQRFQRLLVLPEHRPEAALVGNALIAVGAAHLPGRVGILNLLADKGYTFARVY